MDYILQVTERLVEHLHIASLFIADEWRNVLQFQ